LEEARTIESHSRTTEVWVALRQRRTGGEGEEEPNSERSCDWSDVKALVARSSAVKLRATLTSTMLPEVMSGGRRMDGNSICDVVSYIGAGDIDIGLTSRLSSVSSTATPASTLPTVNETSMSCYNGSCTGQVRLDVFL